MVNNSLKEKLQTIKNLIDECLEVVEGVDQKSHKVSYEDKKPITNIVMNIVNKIGDCEESELIQKKVLDRVSAEAKILMCFYISYKYFKNESLGTGDIELITKELGVKIDRRNATNKLKELRQYLQSESVRRRGQITPYKINRKGSKRFEEILNEDK